MGPHRGKPPRALLPAHGVGTQTALTRDGSLPARLSGHCAHSGVRMSPGELWRRLRFFFHQKRFNAELEEEMRLHLELRAESLGEHAARRQFGNATQLQ